jgi:hypothetical protein
MKKLWVFFTLMLVTAFVFAQEFKPFKVGVGLGFAVPEGGEKGGLFYVEPGYRANSNVLIGLRLESALITRGLIGPKNTMNGEATSNMSYTLNGQYYFSENYVRPFIGAGFGLFSLAAIKYTEGKATATSDAATVFGFYPRVGLDVGHVNLTIDYNVVPKTAVKGGGEVLNSYLGLRLGVSIGGGVGKKVSYP